MSSESTTPDDRRVLVFAMRLSLYIGVLMFILKMGTYLYTGSAAILSDAAESVVHVAAVCFAAYSLRVRFRPADARHTYGHAKISFFSAGFEGAAIVLAALYIIFEAIWKWLFELKLDHVGIGTLMIAIATLVNGALGAYLIWVGRRKGSIILQANGRHVLTDCWTSLGVLAGLCLVLWTGWLPWDPICAIVVACNILFAGISLIRRSIGGLMDATDPETHARVEQVLSVQTARHQIRFHDLRLRDIGDAHWVEMHLLFPGHVSLANAHQVATEIEAALLAVLEPGSHVSSHMEAEEDHSQVHANHASKA